MVFGVELLEILSVIICIHRIYGVRLRFDILTLCLLLTDGIVMDAVYFLDIPNIISFLMFPLIFIYCRYRFRSSLRETAVVNLLFIIIISGLQFWSYLMISFFEISSEIIRDLIINGMVMLICALCLPRLHLYDAVQGFEAGNRLVKMTLFLGTGMAVFLLLQSKLQMAVDGRWFFFSVPAVFLLILLTGSWYVSYQEAKMNMTYWKPFRSLIKESRIRQHNFNNQITAILGMHAIYKTYDELVQNQNQAVAEIREDDRFFSLLQLGNHILSGFLYQKCKELETSGIRVRIHTGALEAWETEHMRELMEALGILLDNGAEAVLSSDFPKEIDFTVDKLAEGYSFCVMNRTEDFLFNEIQEWFRYGKSLKGKGRGIGLYRVRELCRRLENWHLVVEKRQLENGVGICFTLFVMKAGSVDFVE